MQILLKITVVTFFLIFITGCKSKQEEKKIPIHLENIPNDYCVLVTDINGNHVYEDNSARFDKEFLPASTFKIFNSLVSLETGAVKDTNEIIEWDGTTRFVEIWNKDHSMSTAFPNSVVWFYSILADRIGRENMEHYLNEVEYGNHKIGPVYPTFWLAGDLRITTNQQIDFLIKFYNNDLPFSKENIDKVKSIMLYEETEDYKLYAKTGWANKFVPGIGWIVGFIEQPNKKPLFFSVNVDIYKPVDTKYRKELLFSFMNKLGITKS